MEHVLWFFRLHGAGDLLSAIQAPLLIGFFLYQIDYALLCARRLVSIASGASKRLPVWREAPPAALVVMPTLLRNADELDGMKKAITSVVTNKYPGQLYVVAAIDDGGGNPKVYAELESWVRSFATAPNVHVFATCTQRRSGKAVAIDRAVHFIEEKVEHGIIAAFPPIFFNMDGDSELGPLALERMVHRLTTRPRFVGRRPMIVTSNVCITPDVYWRGWREYFTVKGQIAIGVAREYLTSIAIGKYNSKLIPVQEASGALYCTWSELHHLAPRWAAFMQTLRIGSWLRWWVGAAPPSFRASNVRPLPEAQTGPGDDTWMTWLACCASWKNDAISVELPRTPVHAAIAAVRAYFFRPLAYEPEARIVTKTPTTVGALFRQRIRWNSSRIQDAQRWRPALAYHWCAGLPVVVAMALLLYVHGMIVASALVWPFTAAHGGGVVTFLVALALNMACRVFSTGLALFVDGSVRSGWRKLLGLPLSVPFHFVFNILPTIVGAVEDLLLFGVNTKFSPEETYIKSRLSRVAIAYRVRRAFALAFRSVIHNDVPLGTFWFGWHETPFTPNGFEGWTTGKSRVLLPARVGRPVAQAQVPQETPATVVAQRAHANVIPFPTPARALARRRDSVAPVPYRRAA